MCSRPYAVAPPSLAIIHIATSNTSVALPSCATQELFSPAGGVDLRVAALEEASLLLKLAERALPYANAPLVQAAAATTL